MHDIEKQIHQKRIEENHVRAQGMIAGAGAVDAAKVRYADSGAAQCSGPRDYIVMANVKIKAIEDIESALRHVIRFKGKATREGWNGRGMHVEAQWPDQDSKMGQPYLFITNGATGVRTPWVPSTGDLFANDWALLPDNYVYYPF